MTLPPISVESAPQAIGGKPPVTGPTENHRLRSHRPKLDSLQVLRGLAALMVTIAHAGEEAKYFFHINPIIDTAPLGKGVDIFFVISGFIIFYSSRALFHTRGGTKTFLYNRLTRVVPMYYIFLTMMILVVVLLPGGVKVARFDFNQIVTSYTFIPYARYDGRIAPTLSLGWTLNYEIFFYVLFATVMWLPARKAAALAIGALSLLVLVGFFIPASAPAPIRAWTYNIVLEFAMGVGIAVLYDIWGKRHARSTWLAVVLFLFSLTALYLLNLPGHPLHLPRVLSAGVPAAVAVISAVLLLPEKVEGLMPSWMVALGDSSYSLYLSHRFVQRPLQIAVHHLALSPVFGSAAYLLLAVSGAALGGYLVFWAVERPLLKLLRRRFGDPRPVIIEDQQG